jgi:hypothetical protein
MDILKDNQYLMLDSERICAPEDIAHRRCCFKERKAKESKL